MQGRTVWAVIASIIGVIILLIIIYWIFGSIFRPLAVDTDPGDDPDEISLAPNSEVVEGINDFEEDAHLGALHLIMIQDNGLDKSSITVDDGDTVMWINKDKVEYEFEGADEIEIIEPYESFSITYIKPGSYDYTLESAKSIKGTVNVND